MRLLFKGDFSPTENYVPGSIVRMPDGQYKVWTRDDVWQPTAAKPDPFLDRAPRDGRDGTEGRDGAPGQSGRDGAPGVGFNWRGRWERQLYDAMDAVAHEGSSYVCVVPTKSEPPGKAWQLLAAKGEDGKAIESWYTRQIIKRVESSVAIPTASAIFDSHTAKGDVIYVSADGHVDLAQAHADPQSRAIGLATAAVSAGQVGAYLTSGILDGLSGLTPATFISLTPQHRADLPRLAQRRWVSTSSSSGWRLARRNLMSKSIGRWCFNRDARATRKVRRDGRRL